MSLMFLLYVLGIVVVSLIVSLVILRFLESYFLKSFKDLDASFVKKNLRSIRMFILISILLVGIYFIIREFPMLSAYLTHIDMLFFSTWTICCGYVIYRIIGLSLRSFSYRTKISKSTIDVIYKFSKWTIVLIVILILLRIFGILKNVIYIITLVIGTLIFLAFAGWSIIGNITAGIVLMIWKPFEIGDYIEIIPENITGKVEDITLMFVRIVTEKGEVINIPNTLLIQRFIRKVSKDILHNKHIHQA